MLVPSAMLTPVANAQTAASQALCEGADDGSANVSCTDDTSGDTVSEIVRVAIRIFQAIIGVISLFVMLTGGLNYITSGGDSAKTKSARERIMYAVIGLVIVGIAEILVQFALNRVREVA
jgi:hypothetical protein